jgi:hypothetical protein
VVVSVAIDVGVDRADRWQAGRRTEEIASVHEMVHRTQRTKKYGIVSGLIETIFLTTF